MSSEHFDKKIKDKLRLYEPDYDTGAWDSFKKRLPLPWYVSFLRKYGGWVFGGVMSSALIFTLWNTSTQNRKLNDEIFTLSNKIEKEQAVDTVFVERKQVDTIYVDRVVPRYIQVPQLVEKESEGVRLSEEEYVAYQAFKKKVLEADLEAAEAKSAALPEFEVETEQRVAQVEKPTPAEKRAKVDSLALAATATKILPAEPSSAEAAVSKKKMDWPKMRLGVATDYLNLKLFTTGPSFEVFLMDKLSFNTGVLFSKPLETTHPREMDFRQITGKNFEDEYNIYLTANAHPVEVKDISIKTTMIKMPLYLNYYVSTWSRFSFIVSAGTKLDLSVYQDVGYQSGVLGNQVSSRFEARPKPKVLNNLFYGIGLQYQYRKFVGQLTPYFDFRFREADYFNPQKNFGINGSLRFEFGN
ncbi:hypothetical protein LAG90_10890 [Marinilongibacter aquaticus]|uniref:hypothetical protein n=1 Tax=Marinilongibacter aquaticus TaxID=2975157 RepID=UPI0021BD43A3|nr:hypothetical protein [Marinilongibacter aquaticus]UBM57325.1 hypothetical protein LAG90_10890 [Marinilongibacter aquaticus]